MAFALREGDVTKTDDFSEKIPRNTSKEWATRAYIDCDLQSSKFNLWPHNKLGVGTAFTIIAMFPGLNRFNIVPISVKKYF